MNFLKLIALKILDCVCTNCPLFIPMAPKTLIFSLQLEILFPALSLLKTRLLLLRSFVENGTHLQNKSHIRPFCGCSEVFLKALLAPMSPFATTVLPLFKLSPSLENSRWHCLTRKLMPNCFLI